MEARGYAASSSSLQAAAPTARPALARRKSWPGTAEVCLSHTTSNAIAKPMLMAQRSIAGHTTGAIPSTSREGLSRRASAPAVRFPPAQARKHGKKKKTVNFGKRYSLVIGNDKFSEGRRISEVEAQKQVLKMERWQEERRLCGAFDDVAEDFPAGGRPRSRGDVNLGDASEPLPSGRPRSRGTLDDDFKQSDHLLDENSLPRRPRSRGGLDDLEQVGSKEAAHSSLEDFLDMHGSQQGDSSYDDHHCRRLTEFLRSSDSSNDASSCRRLTEFLRASEPRANLEEFLDGEAEDDKHEQKPEEVQTCEATEFFAPGPRRGRAWTADVLEELFPSGAESQDDGDDPA